MEKILKFILFVFCIISSNNTNASTVMSNQSSNITIANQPTKSSLKNAMATASKKLGWRQRLLLKLFKKQVARTEDNDTLLIGLALGLFLGPIGLLCAMLLYEDDDERKAATKGAVIGLIGFIASILLYYYL